MTRRADRLYTLGPEGTFSDRAAQRLREHLVATHGDPGPEVRYTRTIPEVLSRTEADPAALGVFPIENSDTGTVVPAQDSLARHRLSVCLEINLRVRFALLASAPPERIATLYAQPVAFEQCSIYVTEHLPRARPSFTNSNTESGLKFLKGGMEEPQAAIVPLEFAAAYPDVLLAEDIQNDDHNTTRFLVAAPGREETGHDFSRNKTSLFIEPFDDRPGLLYDMLSVFKQHGLNLCRLESRPARVRPWTYNFFLDFNNGAASAPALADLRRGDWKVTVLGSYDTLA
jgi:chorismate mutase/prephenate dehydratase